MALFIEGYIVIVLYGDCIYFFCSIQVKQFFVCVDYQFVVEYFQGIYFYFVGLQGGAIKVIFDDQFFVVFNYKKFMKNFQFRLFIVYKFFFKFYDFKLVVVKNIVLCVGSSINGWNGIIVLFIRGKQCQK